MAQLNKSFSFILDNVLDRQDFLEYKNYFQNTAVYRTVEADGNKKFYVADALYGLEEKITTALREVWKTDVKVILPVVRRATQYIDTNWAIHSDLHVGVEESPQYGAVFYLTQNDNELNGTALWKHKDLGYHMSRDLSKKEIAELSDRDYNDLEKWELSSVLGGIENRLISYPAEYFHSKFPAQAWGATQKDCRIVFVLFYSLQTKL